MNYGAAAMAAGRGTLFAPSWIEQIGAVDQFINDASKLNVKHGLPFTDLANPGHGDDPEDTIWINIGTLYFLLAEPEADAK